MRGRLIAGFSYCLFKVALLVTAGSRAYRALFGAAATFLILVRPELAVLAFLALTVGNDAALPAEVLRFDTEPETALFDWDAFTPEAVEPTRDEEDLVVVRPVAGTLTRRCVFFVDRRLALEEDKPEPLTLLSTLAAGILGHFSPFRKSLRRST